MNKGLVRYNTVAEGAEWFWLCWRRNPAELILEAPLTGSVGQKQRGCLKDELDLGQRLWEVLKGCKGDLKMITNRKGTQTGRVRPINKKQPPVICFYHHSG